MDSIENFDRGSSFTTNFYRRLVPFVHEQIIGSDLSSSMIHNTGFGSELIQMQGTATYHLQGPRILVQVVELTGFCGSRRKVGFLKFGLSDGDYRVNAIMHWTVARALKTSVNTLKLGCKVSFHQ